jgi:hypothetical protein
MQAVKKWTPSQSGSVFLVSLHIFGQLKCFQAIGNLLGDYISADMSFKEMGEMYVAHILVSLNIRGGLQKQFKMTDRGRTRTQILDYEGVPFRMQAMP